MTTTKEGPLADYCRPYTRKEGAKKLVQWHNGRLRNFNPCESPIEHDFLHFFYKVKSEKVHVVSQDGCHTKIGRFRMDFVVKGSRRRIGIKCDGKSFHDKQKDQIRDAAILDSGFVDAIYRIQGRHQWFYPYEVLDLLRLKESFLFSDRGIRLLDRLFDDRKQREDSWARNQVVRTLKQTELEDEDEMVDSWEHYVVLQWTSRN